MPSDAEIMPINAEFTRSLGRFVLIVYFYANEINHLNPLKRITMAHIAAIIKFEKNLDEWVNPVELSNKACNISSLIQDFKIAENFISKDGLNYNEQQMNDKLLFLLQPDYPNLRANQINECRDHMKFMELLERGPMFEREYLTMIKDIYDLVPLHFKEYYRLSLIL